MTEQGNIAAPMREALMECAKRLGIHIVNFKTGVVPPDAETEAEKDENAYSRAFAALAASAPEPGNTAAMREALVTLLAWLDKHGHSFTYEDGTSEDEARAIWQRRQELVSQAHAALSAPPRNCDVGTAEEQTRRKREYCKKTQCSGCPANRGDTISSDYCDLVWAQMPYEGKEESNG